MKKVGIMAMGLLSGLVLAGEINATKEFSTEGLTALELRNTSGDVKIQSSKLEKALVEIKKNKFREGNCALTVERNGNKLTVVVKQQSWVKRGPCDVDFEISLPRQVSLDLKNGSGNIWVQGMQGQIDFAVGSGNVEIEGQVEAINGMSGSGTIEVKGLKGNAKLKSGSGDIALKYEKAPEKGELDVITGSGDVSLLLPAQSKILTDVKMGSGQVYNELGDTDRAEFKVSLRAGSGNLKIKKL